MASLPPTVNVDPGTPAANNLSNDTLGKAALKPLTSPSATSLTPSTTRIATVINKITETVQSPTSVLAQNETGSVLITDEKTGQTRELSLEELRREYEDETVDRFLRVFARQIHEVQMPEELPPDIPGKDDTLPHDVLPAKDAAIPDDDETGEEWQVEPEATGSMSEKIVQSLNLQSPVAAVSNAASTVADSTTQAAQTVKVNSTHTYNLLNEGEWHGRSPAEYVAMEWLVPYLPRPHRKTYQFTFGGMQGTVTRLYLACQPLYVPFLNRMSSLMLWEDPRRSFVYCLLFWVLWFFDMLLPALFARLTYALVRRRVLPYPTAQELVDRRNATAQADVMGAQIREYLDSNISGVGLKDAWKMFRIATKNKKQKAKNMVEDVSSPNDQNDADWREDENSKRAVLAIMEEIADFHERFANLCHWRDPNASTRYAIILGIMILVSMFAPAKYVVKGTYAVGGIVFWFVPNIWLALPLEHRSRIPPPLADVPTDAEYAMGIISQRVDRGEQVLPPELRKKDKKSRGNVNVGTTKSTYSLSPSTTFNKSSVTVGSQADDDSVLADSNADKGKMKKFKDKVKGVVFADQAKRQDSLDENGEPLPEQTFPAKYHATMGMISLTPTTLLFYPMMSSNAKVAIPLSSIRGVKKAGRMGGLRIKYVVPVDGLTSSPRQSMDNASVLTNGDASTNGIAANGEPLEKEEKFGWISQRDEVFAKLVGWGGRRWVKM